MSIPLYFIANQDLFENLLSEFRSIFRPGVRMPRTPLIGPVRLHGFEEFDWLLSGEFWACAQKLANASKDDHLVFAVLEPEPVSYFLVEFGYYNWAILPATLSSDEYWEFLNTPHSENHAESILANAQVVVITVQSKDWAIWGERESGLCLLASWGTEEFVWWNDFEWVERLHSSPEWKAFARDLRQEFEKYRRK